MDLGMNNGDDSAYYLARGHSVVAVEANPTLCQKAHERFSKAVEGLQLTILNAAVSAKDEVLPFFINTANDHWSSLDAAWASREGHPLREISIQGICIPTLFSRYGTPIYLKVDVEGADEMVLDQLQRVGRLPQYLSVEDCRLGYQYFERMAALGYKYFQIVDQSEVPKMSDPLLSWRFAPGSSGPFGPALPSSWLKFDEMVELYSRVVRSREGVRQAPRTRWWDIHAYAPNLI
jgi:FkbM family methyltransferase